MNRIFVDAHARLRGPYTAGGALLRSLVPDALRVAPELVARHDIEILAMAPELRAVLTCTRENLTSTASLDERTRYYPMNYTWRLAQGVADFLIEYLPMTGEPTTLVVDHADDADATDKLLLSTLQRRVDPAVLTVVAGTDLSVPHDNRTPAERYVASECLSEDPAERAAYEELSASDRAALHDARADELLARNEFSLTLGAIPYHRERGADPRGAGADELFAALTHCGLMGFYDAVRDLGNRCLALLDWATQVERCWIVTMKISLAHTMTDQPELAAEAYEQACAASADPSVHLQAAYGRAMLYTRFYEQGQRDHQQAKAHINTAIAIASLSPGKARRAYNVTFQENGLALIEMHLGDLDESLRLVTAGLDRMNTELEPGTEMLHRSVLMSNRAQLLTRMRRTEEAEAAWAEVIAVDPNHSEYYFERAGLYRRLGRYNEAMADYATAIRLAPPYPEPHYNRADLAQELGELDLAEAEFTRVLDLDPEFVDAYVNRASLRYERGDAEGAAADVSAGLAVDPDQPHLHCLRGLLASDTGNADDARESFETALRLDPQLTGALVNLGVLAYESDDRALAVEYFDRALEIDDDPDVRANRELALAAGSS
ncbi:tetratricopeptide repeat protein [Lentzea terrae]|uniref:tetratricopeptide repeat protein n=1 Tax=Lentzea terrae TaxID=2200761 RepID=UPI000DD37592|nr:tetratricopeptide repeat protein [Lentzea terrae]